MCLSLKITILLIACTLIFRCLGVKSTKKPKFPPCVCMFALPAASAARSVSHCAWSLFAQLPLFWLRSVGGKLWIGGLVHLIPLFSQGLNFLIPLLDRIRYVQSLKEIVINVPEQSAVTLGTEKLLCPVHFLPLRPG